MDDPEHDPFNEPETAHAKARELLVEDFFWDCVDEEAPFGSDEGHDAYYEFRRWRSAHPRDSLVGCIAWILAGRLDEYSAALHSDEQIAAALAEPDDAPFADSVDMFTLDTTIIATGLGQLLDEGRIDAPVTPFIRVALRRQLHPSVVTSAHRKTILEAALRVVDRA